MSAEPNWPEWPYTLARVMDPLTHNAATLEDRETVWRAIDDQVKPNPRVTSVIVSRSSGTATPPTLPS